jgi:hypothetical protein
MSSACAPVRFASVRGEHFVQIGVTEKADSSYASGDLHLSVSIASHGFTGESSVWVLHEEVGRFARALKELNSVLRGSATLHSVSPKELELEVLSVSSRGHLAVQGSVGGYVYEPERMYWHAVHFGFEFEPSQLEAVLHVPWVARNAA